MMFHITAKSSNGKTGPIPVTTTSEDSCPPSCPFNDGGCYAMTGPLALHWRKVSQGERGGTLADLTTFVSGLPDNQLWRHNQAGDLPGKGERIAVKQLQAIVKANQGKRGFTYTHKSMGIAANREAIKNANDNGFTINLSGNNLSHADKLAALDIGPVVSVVPRDFPNRGFTPEGRRVVVCPAQQKEGISCSTCKLCAKVERNDIIVGFRAHGTGAKKAEAISNE